MEGFRLHSVLQGNDVEKDTAAVGGRRESGEREDVNCYSSLCRQEGTEQSSNSVRARIRAMVSLS